MVISILVLLHYVEIVYIVDLLHTEDDPPKKIYSYNKESWHLAFSAIHPILNTAQYINRISFYRFVCQPTTVSAKVYIDVVYA